MTVRLRGISNDAVPSFQFIVSALRRSWGDANNDSLWSVMSAVSPSRSASCAVPPIENRWCRLGGGIGRAENLVAENFPGTLFGIDHGARQAPVEWGRALAFSPQFLCRCQVLTYV